jgi:hypothetical protein
VGELTFDKDRLIDVSWGDLERSPCSQDIGQTEDKPDSWPVFLLQSVRRINITHAEAITGEDREATLNSYHRHQGRGSPEQDHQNIEAIKGDGRKRVQDSRSAES